MNQPRSWQTWASTAGVIVVLFMVIYLGNAIRTVENMEERLSYQEPSLKPPTTSTLDGTSNTQTTAYVPAYSHIFAAGGKPYLLETTLSIRNTDSINSLVITAVDYYNSDGHQVRQFLSEAKTLPPLASVEFLMTKQDTSGGAGANFLVNWSSEHQSTPPVIEAVMVGASGNKSISFTSRGVVLTTPNP
ncbi:Uncharacterised protein [BD1-7 clade bacterium]|uniref:DUF3124 domain-containing protein n=1 Tax=BD1-7 clade bacterium TaxID=2029982 RepID=A0A5S9PZ33_9GAMM|nr:Uncharacterised protein [BD1-7 clade bacterium]CAA0112714.1 Uncharacterised protein [BD1-7 clade bacterium]